MTLLMNISKEGRKPHNLSVEPVPVLGRSKKLFPDIQTEPTMFQFVPTLVLVLGTTGKGLCNCLCICRHWQDPHPECPSSFTSLERCSSPSNILVVFCYTLSIKSISLFYCGARNWSQHSRYSCTHAEQRGSTTSP